MNTRRTLLSIDFGSEYIRVAQTRCDPEQPRGLSPQIVEFNGRSSLRNILLLTPDLSAAEEIGEDVFTSDLVYDAPEMVRPSLSLDSDPHSELGQAASYLLQHIYQVLELDHISDEERENWRTLLSIPIQSRPDAATKWVEALERANFPSPQALDSAAAVVAYYRQTSDLSGLYLVIDCGVSHTRVALCQVDDGQVHHVKATKAGRPGGRDFDQALIEHFNKLLADSTILSSGSRLELAYFAEEFKKQFAHEWATGSDSYEALYPVPSAQTILRMRRPEFESTGLAGELIAGFRTIARRILEEQEISPAELDGILLSGGGAHWPFVKAWASEVVGSEKVHVSEYPEEAAVRGLPYLAVASTFVVSPSLEERDPSPHSPPAPPSPSPSLPKRPPKRPPRKPTSVSPARAFWFELIGGLFGLMGMGWFFVLQSVPIGCLGLLGWWVVLAIALISSGVFSVATLNPLPMFIIAAVWLSGPLLSAGFAYWIAKRRNSETGGD